MGRQTPASTAPKPPNYVSRHSSAWLLNYDGSEDLANKTPMLHDYTQMTCCLMIFFWYTGFAVLAWIKAKAAITAYKGGAYDEYKQLNRTARLHMVISVGLTFVATLVIIMVVVLVEENDAPASDALPERD